ncbi:MAG TPA: hypothetical protein VFR37_02535 [Longimicrobium sp.]|nr:hypothetical protein [Longimicrobium sp.]
MKTHHTLPIAILLCAAFASCGRLPTDNPAAPDQASYDSGYTIGSGNLQSQEDGRGGFGIGSGNGVGTGEAGTMDGGTTPTDSTGRGVTIGSGN